MGVEEENDACTTAIFQMSLRGKTRFACVFLCGERNSTNVYAMRSVCSEVNVATAGNTGKNNQHAQAKLIFSNTHLSL